jgi:hypothetical protein
MTPVGRLSDTEWGWIIAAVLFGWIQERATQATSNRLDIEKTIQKTGLNPDPWDAGAIAAILPQLADAAKVDWNAPLAGLARNEMIELLGAAYTLIQKAMLARDHGENQITRKAPPALKPTEDVPWDDAIPAF